MAVQPGLLKRLFRDRDVGAVYAFAVLWFCVVVLPLLCIIGFSFLQSRGLRVVFEPTLKAYYTLFVEAGAPVVARTIQVCVTVTLIELLLAFPFALWLAKVTKNRPLRLTVFLLMLVPFFLSPAARVYVWRSILATEGVINSTLVSMGLIDQPVQWLLFSEFAVHFGLIGQYFPNMVWPLFLSISLIDDEYLEASQDLGASRFQTFWNVILPLSLPGVVAGFVFTFIPMLGDTVVPVILGGNNVLMLSSLVTSYISSLNYTAAAAMATFVLFALVALQGMFVLALRPLGGIRQAFASLGR